MSPRMPTLDLRPRLPITIGFVLTTLEAIRPIRISRVPRQDRPQHQLQHHEALIMKSVLLQFRSHLINGSGLRGCRFLSWVRRDEEAYPQRSATEVQRHPSQKATPSVGQEHFAAADVARSLQTHAGMRVTRALPATTACSCAAPPIYEMASRRNRIN